jgi:RHS repeat-associated protein
LTQLSNGLSTTTYAYDNDGNVVQKTVDGTTTIYVWDYANRLIALGVGGATTTYGYDAFGTRVLQTGTSTTTIYPFKWYSVASSTGTGAKFATTTDYVFNGDTLVATIDQQTATGNATGTAKTRYIHPDHLGSTNVVTDENDTLVQTLDYYPYGSTRISAATGTNEKRQFIGQFTDDSALSYLNARYYDNGRGQFLSQDPTFLALGNSDQLKQVSQQDQQTFLSDPQQLNSYSYGRDNPITKKDPNGNVVSELVEQLVLRPLYAFSVGHTAGTNFIYLFGDEGGKTPQELQDQQAEAHYDAGTLVASSIGLIVDPLGAAGIDAGNIVLSVHDAICATHDCKDLSGGQKSISEILGTIPNGPMADFKLTSPIIHPQGGGGPIQSNGPVASNYSPSVMGNSFKQGGGGGGGGGSYQQLVSLYQSLVSTLSAYVSALNSTSNTSSKH